MKIGYLLGAGFSKYFGLPLANEFVTTAENILKENLWRKYGPTRKRGIFEKLIGFSDHASIEKRTKINNIEELLAIADSRKLISISSKDTWINASSEVRQAIFEILCVTQFLVFEASQCYEIFDAYLRFLDLVTRTGCGPILTLNYDCIIENMLNTAKMSNSRLRNECAARIKINYGIGHAFQAIEWHGEPVAEIDFFKLHGSYNWQMCVEHGFQESSGPLRLSVRGTCDRCKAETIPYLVYPEQRKILPAQLKQISETAFDSLSKVEKLVVIGVKFNPTDSYLLEKIKEVAKRVKLIIIDPNSEDVSAKLQDGTKPILNKDKCGAKFEDVFGFKSVEARREFEKELGIEIRELNNFAEEKPVPPFVTEPLAAF